MGYYTSNEQDEALVRRAMSAYFRFGGIDQPSRYSTGVEVIKGKTYVYLGVRPLVVYRLRNDGKLKLLKRIPKEIEVKYE